MFSVNSLSNFKRVFAFNELKAPSVGGEVFVEERRRETEEEVTWECPAVEEYETLAKNWDKEHVHKWRMLPKPGGAVCRPDDWYALVRGEAAGGEGRLRRRKAHVGVARWHRLRRSRAMGFLEQAQRVVSRGREEEVLRGVRTRHAGGERESQFQKVLNATTTTTTTTASSRIASRASAKV